MRLSNYFLPTLRDAPREAEIVSHQLMLRAGMIKQTSAGIYAWLPMGLKVLRKIEQIVREEQNKAGAQEILMPTIQPAELWQESGRYDAYGKEMLRIRDRHDREMLYGPTNEDMVTDIFRSHINSYKELPKILYHIQWKFRDEVRPRFGVMRGREFLMKDAYSFDLTPELAEASYHRMLLSYVRTFARMGLKAIPMQAETGPIGGKLSHEFIILGDSGESKVFAHKDWMEKDMTAQGISYDDADALKSYCEGLTNMYAATEDIHDPTNCPVSSDDLIETRGIEVGHIFYYDSKYSDAMNSRVQNEKGELVPWYGGSYGIGVSRLVGGIIEACHDENGIIWPKEVAPFHVHLINLKPGHEGCDNACETLYQELEAQGQDVLYDDRDQRAGAKFADADLIGCPWQMVIGPKSADAGTVELKNRKTGEKQELSLDSARQKLTA